jgi:hypothetical protein
MALHFMQDDLVHGAWTKLTCVAWLPEMRVIKGDVLRSSHSRQLANSLLAS